MSAFMLRKIHFVYLVEAAISGEFFTHDYLSWVWKDETDRFIYDNLTCCDSEKSLKIANMLLKENDKSLRYRYVNNEETSLITEKEYKKYRHNICIEHEPEITAIQVLKAIDCYEYQSCEHPDFYNLESYAFVAALKEKIITSLEGYETAKWDL